MPIFEIDLSEQEDFDVRKTERAFYPCRPVARVFASGLCETQIETPNIDRLAREGVIFGNMISTCPVCTPYRSMLLTGRHPQSTGHMFNFVRTRHDEIGLADAFSRPGYKTGWVGKWHLHRGSFPTSKVGTGCRRVATAWDSSIGGAIISTAVLRGWVNTDSAYGERPLGRLRDRRVEPVCVRIHGRRRRRSVLRVRLPAPAALHGEPPISHRRSTTKDLPRHSSWPPNVPEDQHEIANKMYRDYLAMTLALDDMVGDLLDYLDKTGKAKNTLVIFTSDHGTQGGAHGIHPSRKLSPYQESLKVPMLARLPGVFEGGIENDTLTAPSISCRRCARCAACRSRERSRGAIFLKRGKAKTTRLSRTAC